MDATLVTPRFITGVDEALLEDLKAHPKRYVHFSLFGRKDKGEKVKTKEAAISAGDSLPAAR